MEPKTDSTGNKYLEIPLGWDDPEAKLRLTYVSSLRTVRLNKIDSSNHVFPGPEFELQYVPELIEALIKTYNENKAT